MQNIFEFSVPPQSLRVPKRLSWLRPRPIASPEPQFSGFKLVPNRFRRASSGARGRSGGHNPGGTSTPTRMQLR
jgi:hypothetical protein